MHYGPYDFAKDESRPTISAISGEEIRRIGDFTEVHFYYISPL